MPRQKKTKATEASSSSSEPVPTYTHYRNATIGVALQDALDELIADGRMSDELKDDVLAQFDKSVIDALVHKLKSKTTFKVL
jgi:hypothetical protein